jgi:hypothetical protein
MYILLIRRVNEASREQRKGKRAQKTDHVQSKSTEATLAETG